jgi:hypothetical protein
LRETERGDVEKKDVDGLERVVDVTVVVGR